MFRRALAPPARSASGDPERSYQAEFPALARPAVRCAREAENLPRRREGARARDPLPRSEGSDALSPLFLPKAKLSHIACSPSTLRWRSSRKVEEAVSPRSSLGRFGLAHLFDWPKQQERTPGNGTQGSSNADVPKFRVESRLCKNSRPQALCRRRRHPAPQAWMAGDQRLGPEDLHHPLEIVGQDVKADLGSDVSEALHQEVG